MVSTSSQKRDVDFIRVADIQTNPENPRGPDVRENDRRFSALRDSVARFDILVPLVVHDLGDGSYRLIDGERRYHAAKALRKDKVPAIIVRGDMDARLVRQTMFQIHTNWSKWDAAMECHALEAEYAELVSKYGEDLDSQKSIIHELEDRTGDDERTVRNRVQFLRWPKKIKEEVYARKNKYARKHSPYWYIVEIEDKIIEPAMKNYPEYFKVVPPSEVRSLLFRKFQQGLVKAAVEVRKADIVARTPVPDEKRNVPLDILKRLATEVDYSFAEAKEDFLQHFPEADVEPPPSPRTILNQVRKLLEALQDLTPMHIASAYGRARVDTAEMVEALADLESTVAKLREELEAD
jgi:ParB/RepB/Spo0J family partition protein